MELPPGHSPAWLPQTLSSDADFLAHHERGLRLFGRALPMDGNQGLGHDVSEPTAICRREQ